MKQQIVKQDGVLAGKKVVVLGGSSGIGLAIGQAAAHEGAETIIISSNKQRIEAALKELPGNSRGLAADLSDEQQVSALFDNLGHFDHLVYTAGESLQLNNLEDIVISEAKSFFDLRYWGAVTAVKYAGGNINAGGSITLTGGVASLRPGKGWSLGASICAAMEGFTRAMAIELAPLRVNVVAPGIVKTNLWSDMVNADRDSMYAHFGETLPVKFVANAEDIAKTYLYLMCQQYSTGQVVVADGGYVLV